MNKRLKNVILLIVVSLLSVLILQFYYLYTSYDQYKIELKREIDNALETAIYNANQKRIDSLVALFEKDLKNEEIVQLRFTKKEGKARIAVIDVSSGNVGILFNSIDNSISTDSMNAYLLKKYRAYLEEDNLFYWTDTLGKRMKLNLESIKINLDDISGSFRDKFKTNYLGENFSLITNSKLKTTDYQTLTSKTFEVPYANFQKVYLSIKDPYWEILRRSLGVLILSVIVLILIFLSFMYMIQIINEQKKVSELKDDFIDNITHELLTPITSLNLSLETLNKVSDDHIKKKYLDVSFQQAKRLQKIVNVILENSFLTNPKQTFSKDNIVIQELLEEVINYQLKTAQKEIKIQKTFTKEELYINSDRQQLYTVFNNIIDNAIKYSLTKPISINIEAHQKENEIHICISDNGLGIPESEQAFIFDKFHRVTSTNTHAVKGLGLGLYHAKSVINKLGGSITMESSLGVGSTFCIILKNNS